MHCDFLSDVHLEFFARDAFSRAYGRPAIEYWERVFERQSADTLLIAGDIVSAITSPNRLADDFFSAAARRWKHVVCVLGNHDYWSEATRFRATLPAVRALYPRIAFLENDVVEIDGTRLFGATGWSRINPADAAAIRFCFKDYECTQGCREEPFEPSLTSAEHDRTLAALRAALAEAPGEPLVVMTHHAPSFSSNTWPVCVFTQGFCSADDAFIERHPEIRVWVHGHVHEAFDYRIGATRILCNPHAYILQERSLDNPFSLGHFSVP